MEEKYLKKGSFKIKQEDGSEISIKGWITNDGLFGAHRVNHHYYDITHIPSGRVLIIDFYVSIPLIRLKSLEKFLIAITPLINWHDVEELITDQKAKEELSLNLHEAAQEIYFGEIREN